MNASKIQSDPHFRLALAALLKLQPLFDSPPAGYEEECTQASEALDSFQRKIAEAGRPVLTRAEADEALEARRGGVFDNLILFLFGPLGDEVADCAEIEACVPKDDEQPGKEMFALIQEGGSSTELYLHVHGTAEEAEADRVECARKGAYRTSPSFTIPPELAAHGEVLFSLIEEALEAGANLELVPVEEPIGDEEAE
jgi:hypothetical protein